MNRKSHWETVYTDKAPLEVSWYQKEPLLSLELIRNTGLEKEGAIIDVGGGASVLVDYLLKEGYNNLSVLDISEKALVHAKERLGDQGRKVDWIVSDITEFKPRHAYDLWHDRAVFHFLTESGDRQRYVQNLKGAVRSGGHVIVAAFAIGGPTRCSGLDIVQYDVEKLSAELGSEFQLLEERSELHITPAQREQKFGYYRFRRI